MNLPPEMQAALDSVLAALKSRLRDNLYSCALYGSAVRGNIVSGVSDLNLLIVLAESTPEAHAVIAEALRGSKVEIEPFILGREGLERSQRAFAVKFHSIRRHYRVLHGADPLKDLAIDTDLHRFLCEQAVRNLRLRMVHAYVTFGHQPKRYSAYLAQAVPSVFTDLSEILRCEGQEVPNEFPERVALLERACNCDASVLRDLLKLKESPRDLSADEVADHHARAYRLLSAAVRWMESQWPLKS